MSVQVSYPGVYIDEFAPASPIEGVSTSVAAFIGVAERGPRRTPIRMNSLDAFTEQFGGVVTGPTPFYLAPSVEAFFRNGGFDCYVVRASTATNASETLVTQDAAPQPLIELEAVAEGPAGDGITVDVALTSRLANRLAAAGAAGTTLGLASSAAVNVTSIDPTRRVVVLADVTPFAPGDRLLFELGAQAQPAVIERIQESTSTIFLTGAIPTAAAFTKARIDDLKAGDTRLRFVVPAGLLLQSAVPGGTTLLLSKGGAPAESVVVGTSGADAVVLRQGLANDRKVKLAEVASLEFDLTIDDGSGTAQAFPFLATETSHPRYWGTTVDSDAVRLRLADPPPAIGVADPRPASGSVTLGGSTADDPATAWNDVLTSPATYLDLLAPLDDISIVAVPGGTSDDVQLALVAHCEERRDRVCILDAPRRLTTDQLLAHREKLTGALDKGFGTLYHPWLRVRDKQTREIVAFPPAGYIAGIWAKTDATYGVHKAPANVGIVGALGLEMRLTNEQQGPLNMHGVNIIRVLPGRGMPTVWGARTTATSRTWQYINIRRLFNYLEESIAVSLRDEIFAINDTRLWARLKRSITDFLTRTWRDGALFGTTAKEAFYVRIDEALNPPATRKLGRLFIEIGVQPVYPAEFIVVRIGIWDGGTEISES